MRCLTVLLIGFSCVGFMAAQEKKDVPAPRYDVVSDIESYPQGSPKETLTSIAKAIERGRIDYLLAHLSDAQYVDAKVKDLGKFRDLVDAVKAHFNDDAKQQREFLRLLKDGNIDASGSEAKVTLKDVPERQIVLKQNAKRWFLDNPDKSTKK